jgi:hypothetical protein
MAVAFVALIAALSGSAIALPGSNGVNSGDIKNNSVKSADVKNNGLTGKDIRNGRVGSADVKNNGLTGTDINEGSLGQVPSAAAADTATNAINAGNAATVGGNRVARFRYTSAASTTETELFNVGGFRLVASCPGGVPALDLYTANDNSQFGFHYRDHAAGTSEGLANGVFDVGDSPDAVENALLSATANGVLTGPNGVVTVSMYFNDNLPGGDAGCTVSGTATGA